MGQEFAQGREWNFERGARLARCSSIDWHRGVQALVRDCNRAYRDAAARCTSATARPRASAGSSSTTATHSVFAWLRLGGDGAPPVAVVANFTPVPRDGYRIGLPRAGRWREILNTDAAVYGGIGLRQRGRRRRATRGRSHGFACSRRAHAAAAGDALARARRRHVMPRRAIGQREQPASRRTSAHGQGDVLDAARALGDGLRARRRPRQPADGAHRPPRQARRLLRRQVAHHRLRAVERAQLRHPPHRAWRRSTRRTA